MPPSSMRAMRSFVIFIFRIRIVFVSMGVSFTTAVRANRMVVILGVVNDDLRGTPCCCCRVGAVKASAHGWSSRDEEPVAVLVIDRLALRWIVRA